MLTIEDGSTLVNRVKPDPSACDPRLEEATTTKGERLRMTDSSTWRSVLFLCFVLVAFSGCKQIGELQKMVLGDQAANAPVPDASTAPRRPKTRDPELEELEQKAIKIVQHSPARATWTVQKEVANFRKISEKIAKTKQLPKPTGFEWSAVCARGGTCKVSLSFFDGRDPIAATWLISGKTVTPLTCWAMSFMAKLKAARACFLKIAKEKAAQAAKNSVFEDPNAKKPTKGQPKARKTTKITKTAPRSTPKRKANTRKAPANTRKKPADRSGVWSQN